MTIHEHLGILGGTFDPVHYGHIALAKKAVEEFNLDRVIFVPNNISPHKEDEPVTASFHRLTMLELALQGVPEFSISRVELLQKGLSYSIDTLNQFRKTHSDAELFLIMGADAFQDLNTWKNYRQLLSACHIIVGNRPGFPISNCQKIIDHIFEPEENLYRQIDSRPTEFQHPETGRKICFFQMTPTDISSTTIRLNARKGDLAKNILPPMVDRYIMKNQLYKERFPAL